MNRWMVVGSVNVMMIGACLGAAVLAESPDSIANAQSGEGTTLPPSDGQYPAEMSVMEVTQGYNMWEDGANAAAEDAQTAAGAFGPFSDAVEEEGQPGHGVAQASEGQGVSSPSSALRQEAPVPGIVTLPETGGVGVGAVLLGTVLLVGGNLVLVRVLR